MLSDIAREERALPKMWPASGGFDPTRIDWYIGITGNLLPYNRKETVAEFVAAMMLESGLDNLTIGNNARNGSDNPWLGIGWCQLDTGYHATSLEFVHELRQNPLASINYILETPDLCYVGYSNVWFNKQRWHAWDADRLDPQTGFNPYQKCLEAWDRVFAP